MIFRKLFLGLAPLHQKVAIGLPAYFFRRVREDQRGIR